MDASAGKSYRSTGGRDSATQGRERASATAEFMTDHKKINATEQFLRIVTRWNKTVSNRAVWDSKASVATDGFHVFETPSFQQLQRYAPLFGRW